MMILTNHRDKETTIPDALSIIIQHKELWPKSYLETGTGWSGPKTLFYSYGRNYGCKILRDYILSKLPMPCNIVGWGNHLEPGQIIGAHDHKAPENVFSGVYYLTPAILNIHHFDKAMQRVEFNPGDLVIFTPDTIHSVSSPTQTRISIAFNATLRK